MTAVPVSVSGVRRDREAERAVGAPGEIFQELIHELRQPLSVVESLAYYLELTSSDERSAARLQKIQAMVCKINEILEDNMRRLEQETFRQTACYSFDS